MRQLAMLLILASAAHAASAPTRVPDAEVRALWVTRATLSSPDSIRRMVRDARDSGFNTLLVQVRGRGDAYYDGAIDPRAEDLASRPGFDPLAEVLTASRPAGLRVHAWINVNLVSSAVRLPVDDRHLVSRHPEWLMVPRELAPVLYAVDPTSPEYVGRLARWTRAHNETVEGLYVSPVHAGAAEHIARVAADIVSRYPVDGVHLDYVRYPNAEFDYGRAALEEFTRELRPHLTPEARREADRQARVDPTAYARLHPDRWTAFRQARLTALVMRVRTAVKTARPSAVLSAAVYPDPAAASSLKLQDWRTWADQGLLDVLCPMAYAPTLPEFAAQIDAVTGHAGDRPVWAGVGAYRLTPAATLQHIETARRRGVAGVILFSYDALASSPRGAGSLPLVGRAAFGAGSH